MNIVSLLSISASLLVFGSVGALITLIVNRHFWSTFEANDLLGLDPNTADLLFANGTALAVKSFPWMILVAMVGAIILYFNDRYILATIVAWLPLINFLLPSLLFLIKIVASKFSN